MCVCVCVCVCLLCLPARVMYALLPSVCAAGVTKLTKPPSVLTTEKVVTSTRTPNVGGTTTLERFVGLLAGRVDVSGSVVGWLLCLAGCGCVDLRRRQVPGVNALTCVDVRFIG